MEAAANGHCLAHGFHRRGQFRLRAGEFLKSKAWNLGDNIIDAWLKAGRGDTGDVIVQLIQCVTYGQFRRDFRNREPRGLRGKRR